MDCSALACVLAAYCPFLNHTHFTKLYMEPATPEQCSHNAVILVDALQYIGLEYDVLPTDITSPNPIAMILLCAHLYQRLPAYRPRKIITFEGTLNSTVLQKVWRYTSSIANCCQCCVWHPLDIQIRELNCTCIIDILDLLWYHSAGAAGGPQWPESGLPGAAERRREEGVCTAR